MLSGLAAGTVSGFFAGTCATRDLPYADRLTSTGAHSSSTQVNPLSFWSTNERPGTPADPDGTSSIIARIEFLRAESSRS